MIGSQLKRYGGMLIRSLNQFNIRAGETGFSESVCRQHGPRIGRLRSDHLFAFTCYSFNWLV